MPLCGPGAPVSLVGGGILNLITTGMYSSPLAVYREYIQNAADAVQCESDSSVGVVKISIDPGGRRITIRDNGPGLRHVDALRDLLPVARSRKQRGSTDRGFRGIGRLSGLAFAEVVTFRTRTAQTDPITGISWNGSALRSRATGATRADGAIHDCVEVWTEEGDDWPDHFFEVELRGIARYAAGVLLNRDAVRAYISEVCPVPMARDFPYTPQIEQLFHPGRRPFTLQIILADGEESVTRQHSCWLQFSKDREDRFTGFEAVRVPAADGDGDAAIGWLAHSSYLGAISKAVGLRGFRVRDGNIQIGDEYVFDPLFPEERFNRWCVGEIHILDHRIVPNGRRDYFEPGPHIRNLENRLEAVFRRVANRCRVASGRRRGTRTVLSSMQQWESAYDLATSGYLATENAQSIIEEALQQVVIMQSGIGPNQSITDSDVARLREIEEKLKSFLPKRGSPPFGNVDRDQIPVYQRIFQALTEVLPSPSAAKRVIEAVLDHK